MWQGFGSGKNSLGGCYERSLAVPPPMSDPGDLECCILWEACVGSVWEGQHPVGGMSPGGEAESDCRNGRD